ncbi:MAG: SpoIID/LytB domain-containing protein [Candidatus Calescibacterium sp.]|nr:SpoIID/LytB domain-containing protein [Candidatus Calescibacterium sp.]MCX7733655.1 SpoIID/LytB domain-containing protein [bacterium]MDW8087160.1 SpoIID/LytB domain-containing protein [Candidatus Calescibacterium sp.]
MKFLYFVQISVFVLIFPKPSDSLNITLDKDGRRYEIDIEKYIEGVVSGEIPESWPDETIKAQAVVSRSYALYIYNNERKIIRGDTRDQVWKQKTSTRISRLVGETRGWVLLFQDGSIAPGFFHSTCGGTTENAWEMWGGDRRLDEIVSVRCTKCYESPLFFWKKRIKIEEIRKYSKKQDDPLYDKIMEISDIPKNNLIYIEKSSSGRAIKFFFLDTMNILHYRDIRDILPSNFFEYEIFGDTIQFYGRGWGHGVGMCQWGAKRLAEEGFNWKDIIRFYFPKLQLKKIY